MRTVVRNSHNFSLPYSGKHLSRSQKHTVFGSISPPRRKGNTSVRKPRIPFVFTAGLAYDPEPVIAEEIVEYLIEKRIKLSPDAPDTHTIHVVTTTRTPTVLYGLALIDDNIIHDLIRTNFSAPSALTRTVTQTPQERWEHFLTSPYPHQRIPYLVKTIIHDYFPALSLESIQEICAHSHDQEILRLILHTARKLQRQETVQLTTPQTFTQLKPRPQYTSQLQPQTFATIPTTTLLECVISAMRDNPYAPYIQ